MCDIVLKYGIPNAGTEAMAHKYTVIFEGDHVKFVSEGRKNLKHTRALWSEIVRVCDENDCFVVLGVSVSRSPASVSDAYEHAELFTELGIGEDYRIAWTEPTNEPSGKKQFVETVLANRGLPGRIFASEAEARRWLFET